MNHDIETQNWRPDPFNTAWLLATLIIVSIPHIDHLPFWVPIGAVAIGVWRYCELRETVPELRLWMRAVLTGGAVLGIFAHYHTLFGRDAGVAMLTILTALKILETRKIRDAYIVCFLALFLIGASFLYSQSLALGAYLVLALLTALSALVAITDSDRELRTRQRVGVATRVLLQSVPMMVLLFVLFPRIPGPLWGLPADARSGVTGLSDTMSPGNISTLGLSNSVAFRVKFDGDLPPASERYWRGPVLWHTDGREWSKAQVPRYTKVQLGETKGVPYDYTVTLEPHEQPWLFSLDMPAAVPRGTNISADYQLLSAKKIRERYQYTLRSYTDYKAAHINPKLRADALRIPTGFHPRAKRLAAKWSDQSASPEQVVDKALNYFRSQPFYYTLRPPVLEGDTVDEFLFLSRRGFCEHYAAAFTILMRAAGIPARVVTGYQGGEVNEVADYLIVRSRDAHAWSEVWIEGRGWIRVDPTGAVAPDRIERGVDSALPPAIGPAFLGITASSTGMWRSLRHGWDAVNNRWNQWVIDYGTARQARFLSRFGIDSKRWSQLIFAITIGVAMALALVAVWVIRKPLATDPLVRAYERFCAKLSRKGLSRDDHEGPVAYQHRVIRARPDLAHEVSAIVEMYVRLRYSPSDADGMTVRTMHNAVREFRP
ncbi:MAG: DUF3488 and transglutaminase-like domain-containing protein [Gammaproteobacteria bacterium]|nr:DUF3488 and transglutaminase-like domain-containing protein [Gammaproteobacteria bacterium]